MPVTLKSHGGHSHCGVSAIRSHSNLLSRARLEVWHSHDGDEFCVPVAFLTISIYTKRSSIGFLEQ
jgi:hypothetical protein